MFIAVFWVGAFVAAAIARLIAFEVVVPVEMIRRVGLLAALRQLAFVAIADIQALSTWP